MLLISKKEGSMLDKGEFRPVTITGTSYKIFGEIMREKLSGFADKNGVMREEQCVGLLEEDL